jgi:hypothetical protein
MQKLCQEDRVKLSGTGRNFVRQRIARIVNFKRGCTLPGIPFDFVGTLSYMELHRNMPHFVS